LLLDKSRKEADIHALWKAYDPEYFLRNSVDSLVWQTEIRLDNPNVDPLIAIRQHGEQDTLEVFIVTPDRPGIFAAITSALEQCQLNVLDAKINVSNDKEALNTFMVNGRAGADNEITHTLEQYLLTPEKVTPYAPMITPRITKLFKTETEIQFKDHPQGVHTIMTLKTHDRPGLISKLGQGFLQCNTQIINAKINTLGDQVEDIFFITRDNGEALDKSAQDELKAALVEHLSE
jgi:[protein-PII] uridylyltransferase